MKRSILLSMLVVVVLLLPWLRVSRADSQEIVLFDGPRGGWVATVRGDAALEVLEERDGWRRVRLEGWIAGSTAIGAAPAAEEAAAAEAATVAVASQAADRDDESGSQAEVSEAAGLSAASSSTAQQAVGAGVAVAAAEPDRGASISGVLLPTADEQAAGPGAGLVVLLVGDLDVLDEEHARAGKECQDALIASQREVEIRRDKYKKQFNSSDNFKEAANRNDEARRAMKRAEQTHRERIDDCRRAADELFQRHAVQRAISDTAGRFEFDRVSAGEYRVIAAEIGGKAPRAWALDCPVAGVESIVLDPRTDRSAMLPYWGLDRDDGSGEKEPMLTFGG